MKIKKEFNKEWLKLFYGRVNDQFSLSRQSFHNTHHWTITLVFGLVTALFAVFQTDYRYPTEYGFITLLITFPLLLRFFIRSCLEYSIQRKWQEIRNTLDQYYLDPNNQNKKKLQKAIQLFYFEWKSPISIWVIIWDNIKLAYSWPLIIYISLITWGALTLIFTPLMIIICKGVMVFIFIEIISLFRYDGFKVPKI